VHVFQIPGLTTLINSPNAQKNVFFLGTVNTTKATNVSTSNLAECTFLRMSYSMNPDFFMLLMFLYLLFLLLFKPLAFLLFCYLHPLHLPHKLLQHHLHLSLSILLPCPVPLLPILQHHKALVPVPMRKLFLPRYTPCIPSL
jgi:hypothetical protein